MEFVPLLVLLALVKSLVDLVRRVKGGDTSGALTQVLSYVLGAGVVALFAHTAYAAELEFGGVTLANAGLWTQVVIGIAVASAAGLTADALKAVDNTQSESKPSL